MTPIASAAVRSSIMSAAGFALFIFASFVLYPATQLEPRSSVFGALLEPASLATLGVFWLGLTGYLLLRIEGPSGAGPAHAFWTLLTTVLAAFLIVALYLGATALFHGGFRPWDFSSRYLLRLFEAALYAVAIVRISLPLLPRFDRMPPRNF